MDIFPGPAFVVQIAYLLTKPILFTTSMVFAPSPEALDYIGNPPGKSQILRNQKKMPLVQSIRVFNRKWAKNGTEIQKTKMRRSSTIHCESRKTESIAKQNAIYAKKESPRNFIEVEIQLKTCGRRQRCDKTDLPDEEKMSED